jgi:hypothetical protein
MVSFKTGLMTLTTIASIGGALAFNRPVKPTGTPYYSISDGASGFRWVATQPSAPYSCQSGGNAGCTITSTYDVTGTAYNNILPAGAHVQNGADSFYQLPQ